MTKIILPPKKRYWTAVGARDTPVYVLWMMREIGAMYAYLGYIIRSGAARGADWALECGHNFITLDNKEIYIHEEGFQGRTSEEPGVYAGVLKPAMILAEKHYRAQGRAPWKRMKLSTQKLFARNGHQVLGLNLDLPSDFVICWTKDAEYVGGTRQAMYIADAYSVPVYNLGDKKTYDAYRKVLDTFYAKYPEVGEKIQKAFKKPHKF